MVALYALPMNAIDNPYPAKCAAIEKRLPRPALLATIERAGINLTTWYRWRNGESEPVARTWRAFQAELPAAVRHLA